MFDWFKRACDKTDPTVEAHIAAFIFIVVLLGLATFILSIAAIFTTKALHGYIGLILPHIVSLVGYNIYKNSDGNTPPKV